MRAVGLFLFFAGLVAAVSGSLLGCGALFSWNGRHAVAGADIRPGTPLDHPLAPVPGRRYTIAVQVVLDEATAVKMPFVANGNGPDGALFDAKGWIDPAEPHTVVFGGDRGVKTAERQLGMFVAHTVDPVRIAVDLGPDRDGAPVAAARLVVYDDALPPQIARAFALAAAGVVAIASGLTLLLVGFFKRRKKLRGGIRARPVV